MPSPQATTQAAKKELRGQIMRFLADVSQAAIALQTSRAIPALISLPEYHAAKRIGVYLSMPTGEISTAGLVRHALAEEKTVFVPYIYRPPVRTGSLPESVMDMVRLQSSQDLENLSPGRWGIPTPSAESIVTRENIFGSLGTSGHGARLVAAGSGLDLVIMPGVAFDVELRRLGHGKGYYDYFLGRCRQQGEVTTSFRMPFLVGLALNEQLLNPAQSVPTDANDWRLDALVVGDGYVLRSD